MSVPIAMIPYTNMAPYRQLGAPDGCHFVPLVPRESISALMAGNVAAAAVPVGGLGQLGQRVEMVGRFGIAAKGPCLSVMLFSRIPFEEMDATRTVRITRETASSVRLLYLLLGTRLGFDRLPRQVRDRGEADAELLIGDRALVRNQRLAKDEGLHVTDLAEKWYAFERLPFVFARWVVRRDAAESVKAAIGHWLDVFQVQEKKLVDQAVGPSAEALGVTDEVIRRYFRVIRRCLDDEDLQGQARFFKMLDKHSSRLVFPAT
ncbi:MqnA/MqnD/SBP family protein [Desulfosarcina ovata]|uniref:Chorismate dehydratase n=1 Tax=Desulfosarcina ovata subsp. ovata TaxID=2752305 RepID=A0A5K8A349_9BACT|nr:MqnA/MqnD/SBP family protein [Desulfosarcina ovata]BBO86973.1 hypothetical protein DSCOOX_01530 [Desulfosarcina ovata subsp. ovata]